jgi:hypothetical protein
MMDRPAAFSVRANRFPGDSKLELSDYYLHRVITSWLQVGAVVVAAAALVLSMIRARREAKRALTAAAHEGFLKFVELSARYPELSLMHPEKRPNKELSLAEKEIERSAFILLLSTYERLFHDAESTNQVDKLREVDKLITAYAHSNRFRETCELYSAFSENRFSGHLLKKIEKKN